MGSFKGYGRPTEHSRRRRQQDKRKRGESLRIEFLEERRMLSGNGSTSSTIPAPLWTPTDTNLFDAQNGPMANLGQQLVDIYQSYVETGGNTAQAFPGRIRRSNSARGRSGFRSRAWAEAFRRL